MQKRGSLFDDFTTPKDLEDLGFRTFSEIVSNMEKPEEADLAYQLRQDDEMVFALPC